MSFLYAAVTRWRRRHAHPRRLSRPVVSIGNIATGGRAKTPMAALVARVLLDAGERPAVLSRGYGRQRPSDAPLVVRDRDGVRASLAESGDEPLMLAEQLDGAIVVVGADRARAGVAAEQLGATVHVLDDGFQHVRVARDLDIVMLDVADLGEDVLPAGRLREPIDALEHADAIVVIGGTGEERAQTVRAVEGVSGVSMFSGVRHVAPPPADAAAVPAFAVAGIADPRQFVAAVRGAGWRVAGDLAFNDHHRYTAEDTARIARDAAAAGASVAVTTAKDAVRLRDVWTSDLPLHIAEMTIQIDQPDDFARWLIGRLTQARAERAETEMRARRAGPRRAS
ncbi:MAG TPA: tetraacyldisaccharide 4'-kinase [Vicinamibacterales bacterium]|nr:tetraacyldisaccharide 4'-kinase [Vicinamibacterales bacterium]